MPPLLLASASTVRSRLLDGAGVAHEVLPARVDEAALKQALAAEATPPRDVADALAEAKALRISQRRPGRLVLGADQVLALEDRLFGKPATRDEALEHLRALRGRTHALHSAVVMAEDGRPVWRTVARVRLGMRHVSDRFLEAYVAAEGDDLLATVGAYRLEGRGAQLFSWIEGDYFSVLGLPLLEVLAYLRTRGMIDE